MKLWLECFNEESEVRSKIDPNDLCTYGIKCLDDALTCILPNDLVVIGADSGVGKSELGLGIARTNAKRGKRVALFFLEGGHLEAIARMKWCDICDLYFQEYKQHGIDMDYSKWRINSLNHPVIKEIEQRVMDSYTVEFKDNLYIQEIGKTFTLEDFIDALLGFHTLENFLTDYNKKKVAKMYDLDLVVIDHLQYFSLEERGDEIQSVTKILKNVKNLSDFHQLPVVLISHLRKKTKERGLPDQDDFYGSSNIPKISSTAITITSAMDENDHQNGLYPTFFRICKSRVGVRGNLALKVNFRQKTRTYDDRYEVFAINRDGFTGKEPLSKDYKPKWALQPDDDIKENWRKAATNRRTVNA